MEATGLRPGDRVGLRSGAIITSKNFCLKFVYNMFGEDIGRLEVYEGRDRRVLRWVQELGERCIHELNLCILKATP